MRGSEQRPRCFEEECWQHCSWAAREGKPGRCHGVPGVGHRLVTRGPMSSLPPEAWDNPEKVEGVWGKLVRTRDNLPSLHLLRSGVENA